MRPHTGLGATSGGQQPGPTLRMNPITQSIDALTDLRSSSTSRAASATNDAELDGLEGGAVAGGGAMGENALQWEAPAPAEEAPVKQEAGKKKRKGRKKERG